MKDHSNIRKHGAAFAAILSVLLLMAGCTFATTGTAQPGHGNDRAEIGETGATVPGAKEAAAQSENGGTYEDSSDGGHAILADGIEAEYSNATVNKTGDAQGDEADFYGDNAAIFATNGARLSLSGMQITTDGTHANAVFSYGKGTVIEISDSSIETTGNCSGGLMTTGGGTMNASNLTVHTTGNSSAAIRSDRGGGVVTVNGGSYTTDGTGSPAIYSTAQITVNDANLTSTASQGVVVEGKNSVTLNNVTLNVDNNTKNSDKSDWYQAVMIYQSMSGDADAGLSEFCANGGSITNANGDVFFVNNTATTITLNGVDITNNGDGVFLRAAAAGWGREGENGGKVNLSASGQEINGDLLVDDVSALNLYLKDGSSFNGAVNPDGASGDVYVEVEAGSRWILTADSNITSLTCEAGSIELNGHTLTVNGKEYTAGTASTGEAVEIKAAEGGRDDMAPQEGMERKEGMDKPEGMEKPDGQPGDSEGGEPPRKPDGMQGADGGNPPQMPDGEPPQMPDGMMGPGGGNPPEKPN